VLREIAVNVRQRDQVYGRWGFAGKGERGLGISALFAGASGTGKTMAAEVLAHELALDLYRVDLSQVISKYIGETEKNLRRIFDAAEGGAAILLFDEADALFGKRSEVKDSHDRFANIEVSYLLQRMEVYRGLAILTTNLKSALDPAFLRRLRFVVAFQFPSQAQREDIWRRVFPAETPTDGLDLERLARMNVAGGNIRNIAVGAAFLAAEAGEPVRMTHVLRAAEREYAKLERPLNRTELDGP
jgi:SpoVK/Ycf46/Vps4 family AAA+-type ATPase